MTINAKFGGKLTCAFKNDMMNLANFHRLENNDFILESTRAELNQNQNSEKQDRPYLEWKLGNRWIAQLINFLHVFYRIVVFNLKENFQESCQVR